MRGQLQVLRCEGVMPSLVRRVFRSAKRRVKKHMQDQRTHALFDAARQLLASNDYERVSVARIAGEAGVSVGAFYERFSSKDEFLARLIHRRMRKAKDGAEGELHPDVWRRRRPEAIVRAIVEHVVCTLHGAGAGVVRVALKRGHSNPQYLESLGEYRAVVAERAVSLLSHRMRGLRDPAYTVRATVQMMQATALDALLQDRGPLRVGRRRTVDAMTRMMMRSLGFDGLDAAGGEPSEPKCSDEDAMVEVPIEDVVAIEVSKPGPERPIARRRKTTPSAIAKTIELPLPKVLADPQLASSELRSGRGRVRLI